MTYSLCKGHKAFHSADTGAECAFISLRDTERAGLAAISPDGKLFAWVSKVVGASDFCVEVHSLAEGMLKASSILKHDELSRHPFFTRFAESAHRHPGHDRDIQSRYFDVG